MREPKKVGTVEVIVRDAVYSSTPLCNKDLIMPCLSYRKVYWKQGPRRKEKHEYQKAVFIKRNHMLYFNTGLIPRLRTYLQSQGIKTKIIRDEELKVPFAMTRLKELVDVKKNKITLRDDQLEAVSVGCAIQKGIIQAATGVGKSYIMLGLMKCIAPGENILILCHTTSIIKQLYDEFSLFFKSIKMLGGDIDAEEKYKPFKERIVLSTIQSFSMINPKNYMDYFSAVFVDECHRVSSIDSEYGIVLSNLLAPMRIGFTATPPTALEAVFAYEGLLGPIIYEMGINKAAQKEILAKPKIKLVKADYPSGLRDIRDYHSVYYHGIVNNKLRNQQIVEILRDCVYHEETCLCFVNKIEHGNNIIMLANEIGLEVIFVQGSSTTEVRERVKMELENGLIKAVIATSVWKEGVNIPSLNNVINCGGGKSEITVLQNVGRGLRLTEKKKHVTIYDFFDPGHPYLIAHFGERVTLYMENNWL